MTHTFEIKQSFEVTLPHYRKNNFYYYKVLSSDGYTIQIGILPEGENMFAKAEFEKLAPSIIFSDKTSECTEKEFNDAFALALNLLIIEKNKESNEING